MSPTIHPTGDELIATIEKNGREEIRIQRRRRHGYDLVDIRVWYYLAAADEWRPSPRGVCFRRELLPDLRAALAEADAVAGAAD
jgi:hypothetical protein